MDDHKKRMESAKSAIANMNNETAGELRKMVRGEEPYQCFLYTPHRIKNVWLAAADLLEGNMDRLLQ